MAVVEPLLWEVPVAEVAMAWRVPLVRSPWARVGERFLREWLLALWPLQPLERGLSLEGPLYDVHVS